MKVTEFFIGFGPKLVSFRRGETEYGIKPIPLGAYVRIVGHEQPRGGRAGRRGPHLPREGLLGPVAGGAGRPVHEPGHRLRAAVRPQRRLRHRQPDQVDGARDRRRAPPRPTPGSQPGDRVVSLAGVPITTFKQFGTVVQDNAGKQVDLVVDRDGQQVTLTPTIGWALADSIGDTLAPLAVRRQAGQGRRSARGRLRRLRRRARLRPRRAPSTCSSMRDGNLLPHPIDRPDRHAGGAARRRWPRLHRGLQPVRHRASGADRGRRRARVASSATWSPRRSAASGGSSRRPA